MAADRDDIDDRWRAFLREECRDAIEALAEDYPDRRSLYVDLLDLHGFDPDFTRGLFANPDRYLARAAAVLADADDAFERVTVRVENNPGLLSVAAIRVRHRRELVTVEGVVDEVAPAHARVHVGVFDCASCGTSTRRHQTGLELDAPVPCPECGATEGVDLDRDATAFVDAQRIVLAEPDADAPHHLPVYLDDDIVGTVTTGQDVRATGVIRLDAAPAENRFPFYLDAVGVSEERPGGTAGDPDETGLEDLIESRWEFVVES